MRNTLYPDKNRTPKKISVGLMQQRLSAVRHSATNE